MITTGFKSWRWVAGTGALCGLAGLAAIILRGNATLTTVLPTTTLFFGGTALFARMSARQDQWARAMAGVEARRFFAVCVVSLGLIAIAGLVALLGFLTTPTR